MLLKLYTLALLPSLIVQGYVVKKNTPRLPEPEGIRKGQTATGKKSLSVLIVGDSAAAGVGVQTQENALLGCVLTQLQDDYTVQYQLEARTGDTTAQVLQRVRQLDSFHADVVISSVGVNDVTKLTSPKKWIQQQKEFYAEIEAKFTPDQVLITGVPPMNLFPALPNPLAWLFGQYSAQMNMQLKNLVETKKNYALIQFNLKEFKAQQLEMAEDGFHPGKDIYWVWAKELVKKINSRFQ